MCARARVRACARVCARKRKRKRSVCARSLKNIFKELEADPGVSFTRPAGGGGNLEPWAQQGVGTAVHESKTINFFFNFS